MALCGRCGHSIYFRIAQAISRPRRREGCYVDSCDYQDRAPLLGRAAMDGLIMTTYVFSYSTVGFFMFDKS